LNQYPKFANVPFTRVRVNPGDCLFVPGTYIHHVYSSSERNMQVSLLFSGPQIPTAMQRVHGKKLGGPEFSKANDFGAKCLADNKQHNIKIGHVDVAWAYDGVGPITMGFSNPHSYIAEWRESVERIHKMKGAVKEEDFVKMLVRFIDQMDPCSDKTARFSDDTEMRRHVFEAMDVLKPEVSGKHDHWNATCTDGQCQIPMLCTIIKDAVKKQAASLFDKLAKGGVLDPAVFAKQPRRFVQDAMVGTFVRDQVAAVFEEVTGDYDESMASGTSATFERDGEDGGQDGGDGQDGADGREDL